MPETIKILLLVSGRSPQIITETLYTLITQTTPWVPDEIHLVTTSIGKNNVVLELLKGKNYFNQLLNDYPVPKRIRFDADCIHLIEKNGKIYDDLRTPSDNEAAADFISEKVRAFTLDNNTELHVSLAGGRKTMGFYAGYALSLYGRPQDKLSHVLVGEDYESNPDFFYPTPKTHVIHDRNGQPHDAQKAKIWLAEIPFVRMRDGLPKKLLEGSKSFSETIEFANKANDKISLIIKPKTKEVTCCGVSFKVDNALMPLLIWAAERKINNQPPIEALIENDTEQENKYAGELLRIADEHDVVMSLKTEKHLVKNGFTQKDLQEKISKIGTKFSDALGEKLASRCKLVNITTKAGKGYALPDDIHVEIQ